MAEDVRFDLDAETQEFIDAIQQAEADLTRSLRGMERAVRANVGRINRRFDTAARGAGNFADSVNNVNSRELQQDLNELGNAAANASDEVSNAAAAINDDLGTIDSAGNATSNLSSNLGGVASALAAAAAAFVVLQGVVGRYVVQIGRDAFNASSEFQNAQLDLAKSIDSNSPLFDRLGNQAFELSQRFGQSAASLLDSAAGFAQSGAAIADVGQLVEDTLNLSIAGDLGIARSTDIISRSLAGFQLEASQTGEFIDVLNEVSQRYGTTLDQLAAGVAGIAPVVRLAGGSFQDAAAIITPIIEVFGSGDAAATALNSALLQLTGNNARVVSELAALGITQRDANGQLRAGIDIYRDVAEVFTLLSQEQQLFAAQQLVGINRADDFVAAVNGYTTSLAIASDSFDATGSAQREVNARLQSAQFEVNRAREAFNNLAIVVGGQYRDALVDVADQQQGIVLPGIISQLGNLANVLNRIATQSSTGEFFLTLRLLLRGVAQSAANLADVLPRAFQLADTSGLTRALNTLFGRFNNIQISAEQVARIITEVSNALAAGAEFARGLSQVTTGLRIAIAGIVAAFSRLNPVVQRTIGILAGGSLIFRTLGLGAAILATSIGVLAPLYQELNQAFRNSAGAETAEERITALNEALSNITGLNVDLGRIIDGGDIRGIAASLGTDLQASLRTAFDQGSLGAVFADIGQGFVGNFSAAFGEVSQLAFEAVQAIVSAFGLVVGSIEPITSQIGRILGETARAIFEIVGTLDFTGTGSGLDALAAALSNVSVSAADIRNVINTVINFLFDVGEAAINAGIILAGAFVGVVNAINGVADGIRSLARFFGVSETAALALAGAFGGIVAGAVFLLGPLALIVTTATGAVFQMRLMRIAMQFANSGALQLSAGLNTTAASGRAATASLNTTAAASTRAGAVARTAAAGFTLLGRALGALSGLAAVGLLAFEITRLSGLDQVVADALQQSDTIIAIFDRVFAEFDRSVAAIGNLFSAIGSFLFDIGVAVFDFFANLTVSDALEPVFVAFDSLLNAGATVRDLLIGVAQTIGNAFTAIGDAIGAGVDIAVNAFNRIATAAQNFLSFFDVSGALDSVGNFFSDVVDEAANVGSAVADSLFPSAEAAEAARATQGELNAVLSEVAGETQSAAAANEELIDAVEDYGVAAAAGAVAAARQNRAFESSAALAARSAVNIRFHRLQTQNFNTVQRQAANDADAATASLNAEADAARNLADAQQEAAQQTQAAATAARQNVVAAAAGAGGDPVVTGGAEPDPQLLAQIEQQQQQLAIIFSRAQIQFEQIQKTGERARTIAVQQENQRRQQLDVAAAETRLRTAQQNLTRLRNAERNASREITRIRQQSANEEINSEFTLEDIRRRGLSTRRQQRALIRQTGNAQAQATLLLFRANRENNTEVRKAIIEEAKLFLQRASGLNQQITSNRRAASNEQSLSRLRQRAAREEIALQQAIREEQVNQRPGAEALVQQRKRELDDLRAAAEGLSRQRYNLNIDSNIEALNKTLDEIIAKSRTLSNLEIQATGESSTVEETTRRVEEFQQKAEEARREAQQGIEADVRSNAPQATNEVSQLSREVNNVPASKTVQFNSNAVQRTQDFRDLGNATTNLPSTIEQTIQSNAAETARDYQTLTVQTGRAAQNLQGAAAITNQFTGALGRLGDGTTLAEAQAAELDATARRLGVTVNRTTNAAGQTVTEFGQFQSAAQAAGVEVKNVTDEVGRQVTVFSNFDDSQRQAITNFRQFTNAAGQTVTQWERLGIQFTEVGGRVTAYTVETLKAQEAQAAQAAAGEQAASAMGNVATQTTAANDAVGNTAAATQTLNTAMESTATAATNTATALNSIPQTISVSITTNAAAVTQQMQSLEALVNRLQNVNLNVNVTSNAQTVIAQINQLINRLNAIPRSINVSIRRSQFNLGGPVGEFARGGGVRGKGGIDNVPAWLTAGEYVHRVAAVRNAGMAFMAQVNAIRSRGDFSRVILNFLPQALNNVGAGPATTLPAQPPRVSMAAPVAMQTGGPVPTLSRNATEEFIITIREPKQRDIRVRADDRTTASSLINFLNRQQRAQ